MNKIISVILPVWNGENYVGEAIESVLQQDYPHKEVIVVDDGSTDGTRKVIRHFGEAVIYLHQENKGLGASRNTGVRASSGEYLAFLDHDDLWTPQKLSTQMQRWQTVEEQDPLIFSRVQQFICDRLTDFERQKLVVNEAIMPGYLAGSLLLSKKRFLEVGYFFEEKTVGEFLDWYLKALEQNVAVVMLDQLGLLRRVHCSNMGRQHDLYRRGDYLKILKASLNRRRALRE